MQFKAEVVQISESKHNAKGKGHEYIELTYKDLKEGRLSGKRLVDFGDYKNLYDEVQEFEVGQEITIQMEKIKDFWTIVGFGEGEPVAVEKSTSTDKSGKPGPKPTTGPQKWVPDDVRQKLIVRQSSLAQAVAFERDNSATATDVLDRAEQFFNWVMETPVKGKVAKMEVE